MENSDAKFQAPQYPYLIVSHTAQASGKNPGHEKLGGEKITSSITSRETY